MSAAWGHLNGRAASAADADPNYDEGNYPNYDEGRMVVWELWRNLHCALALEVIRRRGSVSGPRALHRGRGCVVALLYLRWLFGVCLRASVHVAAGLARKRCSVSREVCAVTACEARLTGRLPCVRSTSSLAAGRARRAAGRDEDECGGWTGQARARRGSLERRSVSG